MLMPQETKNFLQGILLMLAGVALFFNTMGIFKAFWSYILVTFSVVLFAYGFIKSGAIYKVTDLLNKKR